MDSYTGTESKNNNSIDHKKKRDKISTNRYLMENNGLLDGLGIAVMLPASILNQYSNMEYNNDKQLISFNIDITFCYIKKQQRMFII